MELINRHCDAVKGKCNYISTITVTKTGINFSKASIRDFNIGSKSYVNFVKDKGSWYFYVDNKDNGGFRVVQQKKFTFYVSIHSVALVRLFFASTKYSIGTMQFEVRKSNKQYEGRELAEIITAKPVRINKERVK